MGTWKPPTTCLPWRRGTCPCSSSAWRAAIERRWDEITAGKKHLYDELEPKVGSPIPRKLEDALHVGANSFECLRYPELSPQANYFLTDLPHALQLAILELKQEWQRELKLHVSMPTPESKGTGAIIRAPVQRAPDAPTSA